jgi:uncharacterized protein
MSTHQHVLAEHDNVDVVLGIYDAFSRGDLPAVLQSIDPQADLEFEGPSAVPWTGHWHGREGWTKFFQALGEHVDDLTLTMAPFAAQGEHVVAVGRYQGRVRRTGRHIDSPLVHLWTIRDGMVATCVELTNTAAEAAACAPSA